MLEANAPEIVKRTGLTKTEAAWNCDLSRYLQPGDIVDDGLFMHFLEVVFPACNEADLVQMGEPHDHHGSGGRARYMTLQRWGGVWIFTGVRPRRERVQIG